jgi:hypothetical protein
MKTQPAPNVLGKTDADRAAIQAKTIAELATRCEGPTQFEAFDNAFRASLTVSKTAIVKEEAHQKQLRVKRRTKQ